MSQPLIATDKFNAVTVGGVSPDPDIDVFADKEYADEAAIHFNYGPKIGIEQNQTKPTITFSGLNATVAATPLFLGGYMLSLPTTVVPLIPNDTNFIYVVKDPSDKTTLQITAATYETPISFNRMILAEVTTSSTAVLTSKIFAYEGARFPTYINNDAMVLATDSEQVTWIFANGPIRELAVNVSTTIAPSDVKGAIVMLGTSTVAIPNTTDIPVGAELVIFGSVGATTTTISPAGGTSLIHQNGSGTTGQRTLTNGGFAKLRKVSTTVWYINGQNVS